MRNGELLNAKVGEYRMLDFLGAGGMGEVYRAVHAKLGRVVAVKVMTQAQRNPRLIERFHNEAQIQARLQHPRIATLFDFIEANGMPCIVMEYVDGETLDERIRACGVLPLEETLHIFRAVVEAIGYLHENGIVHRDIKSNNIKINSRGEVKLLDFGIAKSDASPQLTATGDVIGTLQYLSPEQIKGGGADPRSDIWALGVLLYEMVSGQVPFNATTLGRLCDSIMKSEYLSPSTYNPSLPKAVEAIIKRCLKKNPEARYQTTEEILKDLSALQRNETPAEDSQSNKAEARSRDSLNWLRRSWQLVTASALALLAIAVLAYVVSHLPLDPPVNTNGNVATAASKKTGNSASHTESSFKTVRINALEGKAEVYQNGALVGQTPCDIKVASGEKVNLVLKRNGFEDKKVDFLLNENQEDYTYTLSRKE
ncbi:MAG: serine/threonine protein kinase [Acidobacteria bacterium]|nr:serine/threonine protein kinase [Acidobacteriota bacterium]